MPKIKNKYFVNILFIIIFISLLFNYYIYNNYTKFLLKESGDLSRVSYDLHYIKYNRNIILEKPKFKIINADDKIDNKYDIITFGDSFMNGFCENTWIQNYINNSFSVAHIKILAKFLPYVVKKIEQNPPRYFLLERVERGFKTFLDYKEKDFLKPQQNIIKKYKEKGNIAIFKFLNNANMKFLLSYISSYKINNYILNKIKNILLNNSTVKKKLSHHFFTIEQNILFFTSDDYRTKFLSTRRIDKIVNNLKRINKELQKHGIKLVVAIIPDKLTVYGKYLINPIKKNFYNTLIMRLRANNILCIDLLKIIDKYIFKIKDFYIPDDTHISKIGAKVIGKEIGKYLKKLDNSIGLVNVKK